jgi:predicted transcriptional regulator
MNMSVGTICTRKVISVDRSTDVAAAADVMRSKEVGYLVVTDAAKGGLKPVGVVTDRDLVIKVMARDIDPHMLKVSDVMTPDPLIAAYADDIGKTLHRMRALGVRRVPVIDSLGRIAGVMSLDDAFDHLVVQMADVAGSIRSQKAPELRPHI